MAHPTAPSTSGGGTNLDELIKSMTPTLDNEIYVFAKLPFNATKTSELLRGATTTDGVKMIFREEEAWTMILPKSAAEAQNLEFAFACRQITLNVHSSLDAVGFLAAITTRLARKLNVGINPVSAFHHDHLYVPNGVEQAVLGELFSMAAEKA
jgi:hypothetical protein